MVARRRRLIPAPFDAGETKPRKRAGLQGADESAQLAACLQLLALDQNIAWFHRMNAGAFRVDDRFIRVAFKGCPDIMGQVKDGRLFAFEVKSQGRQRLTPEQAAFLGLAGKHGACVGWGTIDDLRVLLCGLDALLRVRKAAAAVDLRVDLPHKSIIQPGSRMQLKKGK